MCVMKAALPATSKCSTTSRSFLTRNWVSPRRGATNCSASFNSIAPLAADGLSRLRSTPLLFQNNEKKGYASMNVDLRNITNNYQDVKLISLSTWRVANEFTPRDRHGPYVVLQEGYDPEDTRMIPEEFVLGRSGKWLSLGFFYQMPVPERRAEFIFGTV